MTAFPPSPTPSAPAIAGARSASSWLLGLSLILIAVNLRPVFGSLSVVLPEIMRDTGLSATGASMLTTLPILCLGIFSAPTPTLARRFGAERVLLLALLLILAGTLLRAAGTLPALFTSAVLAGAGIAMGNVLLPGLVKRNFAQQAALMTGLYTLAICAGASSAAAFTVPMEIHWFSGSWPYALAIWAALAFITLLIWAPQALRARPIHTDAAARVGSLMHDKLAWQVTFFMGLQSALAYIVMGWMAPILRERGVDSATAGYLVGTAIVMQLGTCLITPSLAARQSDQRGLSMLVCVLILTGLLGFYWAPLGTPIWLAAMVLGTGLGGAFSLALSLIVMRSGNAHVTAQLSAMAQGWGYVMAAGGPLLVGVLRSITGSYSSSVWLVIFLCLTSAIAGWGAGRNLLVQPQTR